MNDLKFSYSDNDYSTCFACKERILFGQLKGERNETSFINEYHFGCFIDARSIDGCSKDMIKILLKEEKNKYSARKAAFVSLEVYDKAPENYNLAISNEDLITIREQISLSYEHKTDYYIPSVVEGIQATKCPKGYCFFGSDIKTAGVPDVKNEIFLVFQGINFHAFCLSESQKVNVQSKEIRGYNALNDDKKKLLDKYFKEDRVTMNQPIAQTSNLNEPEFCSKCCDGERLKSLRIQYKTKSYHPKCFAVMGKVNIDAKDIGNYTYLEDKSKLNNLFKKINVADFDIPLIEKANMDDYCNAAKCLRADAPSKFPYPYTIKFAQLQVKFHGDCYHPKCFQSTNKVNLAAKDFYGYNELDAEEKQALNEIFVQNDVVVDGAVDGDNGEDLGAEHGDDDQETKVKIEVKPEEPGTIQDTVPPNNEIQSATAEFSSNVLHDNGNTRESIVKSETPSHNNMVATLSENVGTHEFDTVDNDNNSIHPPSPDNLENGSTAEHGDDEQETEVKIEVKPEEPGTIKDTVPPNNEIQSAALGPVSDGQNDVDIKSEASSGDVEMQELDSDGVAIDGNENQPSRLPPSTTDDFGNGNHVVNAALFKYKIPNDDFIQSIFEELRLPDSNQVYHFWADVSRNAVFTAASTPSTTFDISSADDSFFKSLSCFFTGKEDHCYIIKPRIQSYFHTNFKKFGTINGIDFSKLDPTSNQFDEFYECTQLSNIHFNIICEWLKCRIGIFSSDGLQKYGSWEEEGHPFLLIQNENDFYKPVLSFI